LVSALPASVGRLQGANSFGRDLENPRRTRAMGRPGEDQDKTINELSIRIIEDRKDLGDSLEKRPSGNDCM